MQADYRFWPQCQPINSCLILTMVMARFKRLSSVEYIDVGVACGLLLFGLFCLQIHAHLGLVPFLAPLHSGLLLCPPTCWVSCGVSLGAHPHLSFLDPLLAHKELFQSNKNMPNLNVRTKRPPKGGG